MSLTTRGIALAGSLILTAPLSAQSADSLPGAEPETVTDVVELSTADRLAERMVLWTAVNVFVTLVTAVVGFLSVREARRTASIMSDSLREQHEARKQAEATQRAMHVREYFRILIAQPTIEGIPRFRQGAIESLKSCRSKLSGMTVDVPREQFDQCTAGATRDFNLHYQMLEDDLISRARAWQDAEFTLAVRNILVALQDEVTGHLRLAVADSNQIDAGVECITHRCAEMIGLVIDMDLHRLDPLVHVDGSKDGSGSASASESVVIES